MNVLGALRGMFRGTKPEPTDDFMRQKLVDLVLDKLRDKGGRIRVEDAITVAATIVGERCIDAAGDYPLRDHELVPGTRAFSTKANVLISGDVLDQPIAQLPQDSIIAILHARLDKRAYADADFPALEDVAKGYAARIGKPEDWGKVPLSVPQEHFPFVLPLQAGYETRGRVDAILGPVLNDKPHCLRIATEALADILSMVASAIDRKLALAIAIETVNGMAKTMPMTEKALRKAQQDAAAQKH